ncbi:MAG: ImmA/IrrE family metallo-endopeptidase [Geobacteraceae bacterium]
MYHPEDSLPVPIEEIVEFQLKLDIIPMPGLLKGFEIDGFLSRDFSSIYVDDFIQGNRLTRYRFTLAHEVGHLVLHRELLDKIATFGDVDSWREFVKNLGSDKGNYEYQGYTFAGCVLVPKHHLVAKVRQCLPEIDAEIATAKKAGVLRAAYLDFAVNMLSDKLAGQFDVSSEVIQRRIKNDKLDSKIP